jgi:hypothetical protein
MADLTSDALNSMAVFIDTVRFPGHGFSGLIEFSHCTLWLLAGFYVKIKRLSSSSVRLVLKFPNAPHSMYRSTTIFFNCGIISIIVKCKIVSQLSRLMIDNFDGKTSFSNAVSYFIRTIMSKIIFQSYFLILTL